MNVIKVLDELKTKYPTANVFKNDEVTTTEILCEIDPTTKHSEYSNAIAIIDKSVPHIHYKTTETYKVLRGTLTLHIEKDTIALKEGETYIIKPNTIHWAEGNETWIECYSEPGWTFEDHVILN